MALSGGRIEENDLRVGLLLPAFGQVADFGTTLQGYTSRGTGSFQWRTGDCCPRVKGRPDHHAWKSLVGNNMVTDSVLTLCRHPEHPRESSVQERLTNPCPEEAASLAEFLPSCTKPPSSIPSAL